jgi:predicted permease
MPLREALVGDTRTPLLVLMASAALVLLITCANLAGALLSRTLTRRREFAVRTALGAGRGRLVRQLLTETSVLAIVGGGAGLLLAAYLLEVLRGLRLAGLPAHVDLTMDGTALAVTALVTLATGLAFGAGPAISASGSDPQHALGDATRGASESGRARHVRGLLVAGQMALCVSLLVGAGLLARSLWAMHTAPLGFNPAGVLTATVQLPAGSYPTPDARLQFFDAFMTRLSEAPGVTAVARASGVPTDVRQRLGVSIEGMPMPADSQPLVLSAAVSHDYFRTLEIPVIAGRTFDTREGPDTPLAVVINESMARRYWRDGDALGARLRLGPDLQSPLFQVIGVVANVRNNRTRPDVEPMLHLSTGQVARAPRTVFLLRTGGDPLVLTATARRELAALDPGLPLQRVMTLDAIVGDSLAIRRLPVMLMTAFGALALLLASVGVYAMFATMAAAREREFGLRLALGSRPGAIAVLVLRQGMSWMAVGLAAGAVGVIVITGLIRELLYGVDRFDPMTLAVSLGTLAVCATLALFVPVRRAARVDPAIALRAQ